MADRRFDQEIISAGITINTAGILTVSDCAQIYEFGFYVKFAGGANAGVVKIETADSENYSGTWAVLATITFAADAAVQYVAVAGSIRSIRARISTAIGGGGNVTVRCIANR